MIFLIKRFLRKGNSLRYFYFGNHIVKNSNKLFNHFNIQTILDVGANTGQFAYYTRQFGFRNNIISFEPLSSAYDILSKFSKKDRKWQIVNSAIGDMDGEIEINISLNSQSSSILEIMPSHVNSAPDSVYIGKEKVLIHKLDTIIENYTSDLEKTFLKIDTQGFEKNVLAGATESLKQIKGLQVELSLVELYNGEILFDEMIKFILAQGFTVYSMIPGFYDRKSGQLLQVDVIFYRK